VTLAVGSSGLEVGLYRVLLPIPTESNMERSVSVSFVSRLVPNEPDDADHRQDHAQGCDSNCPKSILPIAIALHPGTSLNIIGDYCGTPLNSM
jgi:hypothetical protein